MIETMFDRIADLPQWAQIFLITLFFLGSGGGILSVVINYLKSVNDSVHKERLEVVENAQIRIQNEQIKIKSEAETAASNSLNTQKLIEVIASSNDRWQRVFDVKSERQLETDKMQHETNKMFLDAVNRQTNVVSNLTEMLEIQSEQYGKFADKLATTLTTVETLARDSRADVTTALGMNVNQQTKTDDTLRTILTAVTGIEKSVTGIISQSETERNQNLAAIKAQLQAIETSISKLIEPRPTLLGDTIPIPELQTTASGTWNEETETTAIIPPNPHEETKPPKVA